MAHRTRSTIGVLAGWQLRMALSHSAAHRNRTLLENCDMLDAILHQRISINLDEQTP
jgi:hypothetical protein